MSKGPSLTCCSTSGARTKIDSLTPEKIRDYRKKRKKNSLPLVQEETQVIQLSTRSLCIQNNAQSRCC